MSLHIHSFIERMKILYQIKVRITLSDLSKTLTTLREVNMRRLDKYKHSQLNAAPTAQRMPRRDGVANKISNQPKIKCKSD